MKRITLLLLLFSCFSFVAQNKVPERIAELHAQKAVFKKFSVLESSGNRPDQKIDKVVSDATFARIKTETVNEIVKNKYETIEVEIPYNGKTVLVELYKVNLFAEGFHVDTDKANAIEYTAGVYYRGVVKGDGKSVATMNFFNNELNGVISNESLSNLVVGKLDKKNNVTDYIIYSDANLKVGNDFICTTSDEATPEPTEPQQFGKDALSTKCVTMYIEMDNDLYVANGSDTQTTNNWMTSVFNNVQTLYNNDGITVALKSVFIWTTPDPYDGTSTSAYLAQFHEVRPVFDGDVGQLIGIDPVGGGVAVGINGLCTVNNFSYSDVFFSYSSVPTFSWTVQVITHEFGHLLGSRHTHACAWNGNNTPIDNCAPVAIGSSAEGYSCLVSPPIIPTASVKGTIMSYCHLINGVGISFNNGFGPQPAAAILNAVNSRACLSTDCINTCINTVSGITTTDVSPTEVVINWTDLGSTTSWQISVQPYSSTAAPVWNTVNVNNYTASGLNSNSYYKVRIRPVCSTTTVLNREFIFATGGDYCGGLVITDTGGSNGNYGNLETYVRTIKPNVPGQKIKLTFTSFGLENEYDYLYIYNGSDTSFPEVLAGGYTGNAILGVIESTAPDGSLTLKFVSDQLETGSGFEATVSCAAVLGVDSFDQFTDFSYYPNPTNGIVTITSKDIITDVAVYNPQGRLLYKNKANALDTKVDLSSFATGTYFFKLKLNDKEVNFKVLKNN
ncbi:M12 family metallo-peptidase [Flavobacterium sp. '19STA2R22 D10 B1']|uniref:M12 family metallo-peptidase n=1 Tax=Flavobacterium aerium TaxID=3037261 RepID=UPI00278BB77F|nr:M12 family metallo-peptidase [Flavobacterium sp. '19STA2R22 D10 B1']